MPQGRFKDISINATEEFSRSGDPEETGLLFEISLILLDTW
jgi:hypothetical protein